MINKKAQKLLYKFLNEKKEVIEQGNCYYRLQLYKEFLELNPDFLISLDSFRYRLQQYREKHGLILSRSRAGFKEAQEMFYQMLDENPDLLNNKHWIYDDRVRRFINAEFKGCHIFENNLRQWMRVYKKKYKKQ